MTWLDDLSVSDVPPGAPGGRVLEIPDQLFPHRETGRFEPSSGRGLRIAPLGQGQVPVMRTGLAYVALGAAWLTAAWLAESRRRAAGR